jgi:hypothetical protein
MSRMKELQEQRELDLEPYPLRREWLRSLEERKDSQGRGAFTHYDPIRGMLVCAIQVLRDLRPGKSDTVLHRCLGMDEREFETMAGRVIYANDAMCLTFPQVAEALERTGFTMCGYGDDEECPDPDQAE